MPGRNPDEAWRAFVDPIKRAVGAVDQSCRLGARVHKDDRRTLLTLPDGRLQLGGQSLQLDLQMTLESVEPDEGGFRWSTRRYLYDILDTEGSLFQWHWHPKSKRSRVVEPHLHVRSSAKFSTKHIPTGRITLEDVLLFAIDELGATEAVAGGRDILEATRQTHKEHRSWT